MHPSSAEYSIVRTYLDWLAILPWSKSSRDRLDLKRARKVLDADHYDLEKIKERILEYLAVRKLKKDMKGPILCLVGPPGTGKTSLGKSIARALGREFVRVSLGGVHDEAEIRGHRRTYVAAMPGRIIQGIRKAGTNNPVFMLDEVDKLGADFRGDPSAALARSARPRAELRLPRPLPRRRLRPLEGHVPRHGEHAGDDPLAAAGPHGGPGTAGLQRGREDPDRRRSTSSPSSSKRTGWTPKTSRSTDDAVRKVIADYTREAGLRNLEREIAAVCRKVARRRAEGKQTAVTIGAARRRRATSARRSYFREVADRTGVPGVATGLAWTPTGGEILFIEATGMPGKGGLTLTGLLGESMKESAQAAMSYLRSHAKLLALDASRIAKTDVHIHVPAGAVPKDGPSAGVAIASALISLFRDKPIRQRPGDDRRGHADRPGPARRRRPREGPGRPPGRDQDGAAPPAQREGPGRAARRRSRPT